jgi:hypothetical protein
LRLSFPAKSLKSALRAARVIKPETKDYSVRIEGGTLSIFCYDKRRYVISRLQAGDGTEVSADFFLHVDKSTILDSDLETVSISMKENTMTVKAEGSGQSRSATLKSRSMTSRRPKTPAVPSFDSVPVKTKDLDWLLRQLSCSALVKETKTEDDMRTNQVHMYPDLQCAGSNATFYGTIVLTPGLSLDLSVISSDIPTIRAFCSSLPGEEVLIGQNKTHLFIVDRTSGSTLALGRVASSKPPFSCPDMSKFRTSFSVPKDVISRSLEWSSTAVEGTQRVTFDIRRPDPSSPAGEAVLSSKEELTRFPVSFVSGTGFCTDLPIRYLSSMISYIEEDVVFHFGHEDSPTILGLSSGSGDRAPMRAMHFVNSMKSGARPR